MIWVRRGLFGRDGDPARPIEGVREEFIDALTHDSVVVQIPCLTGRRRTELERLLAVFDQSQRAAENAHLLAVDTTGLPERFGGVVRRLEKAAAEPDVLEEMDLEDEFLHGLEEKEREAMQVAERERRLKELALRRAARARKREEDAKKREEQERRLKEEALAELERLRRELRRQNPEA